MGLDKSLEPFANAGCTDAAFVCHLSIAERLTECDSPDIRGMGHIIFEAHTTWGLYGISQIILAVPALREGSPTQLLAEFDNEFKYGTIYMGKAGAAFFLYPFLELLTIILLGKGHGALLHSSCVDDNGRGYLFVGQSGSGKSTMANLWNGRHGVRVLNDDRVIISETAAGLVAYGTPWCGTAKLAVNACVPISKIFFVGHAERNIAVPVSGIKTVSELIKNAFLPFWDKDGIKYSIGFIDRIARQIDVVDLGFVPGEEVINLVRNI